MRVAGFAADVTPPIGTALGLAIVPPAIAVTDPLTCRGMILLSENTDPIVVCALDWIGIAGSGHAQWRAALADAAGTTPDRVALHTLHQHDTPGFDPDGEAVMAERGWPGRGYDAGFVELAVRRAQAAIRAALNAPARLTHVGLGVAPVVRVASSRRVIGPDGNVTHVRFSSDRDPLAREAPEGLVDPLARVISFWEDNQPRIALSYYATHPMSHYRERLITCDFVGLARERAMQTMPGKHRLWVHFNGAGGNITAGKYNDGSPRNRPALADRLADGLASAFADSADHRSPIEDADVGWASTAVVLPLSPHLAGGGGERRFEAEKTFDAAREVSWARRCRAGATIDVSCLSVGDARVLHMPGELFVEYQLAAQALRPDLFVATAAYGDYAPGYIGTKAAYPQGGYETGTASRVAADTEDVLFPAIARLLGASPDGALTPSQITEQATASALSAAAGSLPPVGRLEATTG